MVDIVYAENFLKLEVLGYSWHRENIILFFSSDQLSVIICSVYCKFNRNNFYQRLASQGFLGIAWSNKEKLVS